MKKSLVFTLLFFSSCAFAEEADPLANFHRSLRDEVFVVESSDEDASGSLDRISGNIDLGFASQDQSYQSANHYKAGPFGQTDAKDKLSAQ